MGWAGWAGAAAVMTVSTARARAPPLPAAAVAAAAATAAAVTATAATEGARPRGRTCLGVARGGDHWLSHQQHLLAAALEVARLVQVEDVPVLVHCSHGWDLHEPVCAVSQLLLDPFFRTLRDSRSSSRRVLRPATLSSSAAPTATPPTRKGATAEPAHFAVPRRRLAAPAPLPSAFGFNGRYLLAIAEHVNSCRFGTFLFNCERERRRERQNSGGKPIAVSLWSYLRLNRLPSSAYS